MKRTDGLWRLGAVAFWLLIWWGAARLANRRLLMPLPTPVSVLTALGRMAATLSFWQMVGMSLLRITVGFLAAVTAGSLLAVACAYCRPVRLLFAPLKHTARAIPVASLTVVVFLWFPREIIPGFISFITVLPLIWDNLEQSLLADNGSLKEMARVMGLPEHRILTDVTLPSVIPYFTAALAGGLGFAFKSGVAAEIICRARLSLGDLMWQGKTSLDYDSVFAVTLVVVLMSLALEGLVKYVTKRRKGV